MEEKWPEYDGNVTKPQQTAMQKNSSGHLLDSAAICSVDRAERSAEFAAVLQLIEDEDL